MSRRWVGAALVAGVCLAADAAVFAQARPTPQQRRERQAERRAVRPAVRQEVRQERQARPAVRQNPPKVVVPPKAPVRAPGPHAGDWLRNNKDLPLEQQKRALQNDPQFRKLPPKRQEELENRLQRFNARPPEERERMLQRMETWEHLTPGQQQHARDLFQKMKQLPPERRRTMTAAVRNLRQMPPEQRQQVLNSERFRGMFSAGEREMLNGVTQLPMAAPGKE